MRHALAVLAPIAGALALALATQAPIHAAGGPSGSVTLAMKAQNGSVLNGTATITQDKTDPKSVTVSILYKDVMFIPENFYPTNIHKGTCAKLDPKAAYPLKAMNTGKSVTVLKGVSLAELLSHPYAINVGSPTDTSKYLSCGQIVAPAVGSKSGYKG
jgi:hypothetical protein